MSGSESVSKLINYISKHNGKMIQGGKISSKKKPKCCWTYVNRDRCDHTSGLFDEGVILGGLWHPDTREKSYLKSRSN